MDTRPAVVRYAVTVRYRLVQAVSLLAVTSEDLLISLASVVSLSRGALQPFAP